MKQIKSNKRRIIIILISIVSVVILAAIAGIVYLNSQKLNLHGQKKAYLYIPTNANFNEVTDSLTAHNYLKNNTFFKLLAQYSDYSKSVKPGRYEIENGMSVFSLIKKLKSGNQSPVQLVIKKTRTKEILSNRVARRLELDSLELYELLGDAAFLEEYNLTPFNSISIFIPNTYEFFWNTNAKDFFKRMAKESKDFWNKENRMKKAQKMGFTPQEIIIIASIVDEETNQNSEKPIVASVYLNRLRKGMKLQADPTVKFAYGDFELKRITRKQLEYDSPYNTYIYEGLPPGPICMPNISSIDAVLQNMDTDYLFFCAKEDFSGYHNFAVTATEHMLNARKYHQALNDRNIISK